MVFFEKVNIFFFIFGVVVMGFCGFWVFGIFGDEFFMVFDMESVVCLNNCGEEWMGVEILLKRGLIFFDMVIIIGFFGGLVSLKYVWLELVLVRELVKEFLFRVVWVSLVLVISIILFFWSVII